MISIKPLNSGDVYVRADHWSDIELSRISDSNEYVYYDNVATGRSSLDNFRLCGIRKSGETYDLFIEMLAGRDQDSMDLFRSELSSRIETLRSAFPAHIVPKSAMAVVRTRRRTRGSFGDELDIHEVRAGRFDRAWSTTRTDQSMGRKPRAAHVFLQTNGVWMTDWSESLWRAAALYVISESLQKAGYSLAVSAATQNERALVAGGSIFVSYSMKAYQQALNVAQLAIMGTLAWHRTMVWRTFSCQDKECAASFGYPVKGRQSEHPLVMESVKRGEMCVFVPHDVLSRDAAEACVRDAVRSVQRQQTAA